MGVQYSIVLFIVLKNPIKSHDQDFQLVNVISPPPQNTKEKEIKVCSSQCFAVLLHRDMFTARSVDPKCFVVALHINPQTHTFNFRQ